MLHFLKTIYKKNISERTRLNVLFSWFKVRGFLLRGTKYFCICCNGTYQKFLSHGNIPRKLAVCPNCHSLERTRVLMYYLLRETDIFKGGKKILHFAPEYGIEKNLKKTGNYYITGDINPAYANHVVDITDIPYKDNYFDYILCSHVLGHVADEVKAIDEMYRVLANGGTAIVLTPVDESLENTFEDKNILDPGDRKKKYGEPDLLRLHGKDFIQRLKRRNVHVTRLDYRLTFSDKEREQFSLGNGTRELLFICKKK
jgi:SAM-dependent methyltransferase